MNPLRNVLIAALASTAATSLAVACGGSTTNSNSSGAGASSGSGGSSGGGSGSSSGTADSGGGGGRGGRNDGGPITDCTDFNGCPGNNICCTVAGTTGAGTQTMCTNSTATAPTCPAGTQQACSGANTNDTCSPGGDITIGACNFSCNAITGSTYSVCVPMTGVNCDAGSSQGGGSDAAASADSEAIDSATAPQDAPSQ